MTLAISFDTLHVARLMNFILRAKVVRLNEPEMRWQCQSKVGVHHQKNQTPRTTEVIEQANIREKGGRCCVTWETQVWPSAIPGNKQAKLGCRLNEAPPGVRVRA